MLQRSDKVQMAHDVLAQPDRELVMRILDSVNITPFQRQLVIDTELSRMSMKELATTHNMSYSTIVIRKRRAMEVIADYLASKASS